VEVVEQRQQLRDVVALATGQRDGERDAHHVDEQVVPAAGAGTTDRARPRPTARHRSQTETAPPRPPILDDTVDGFEIKAP
jgi:hypothetical protein